MGLSPRRWAAALLAVAIGAGAAIAALPGMAQPEAFRASIPDAVAPDSGQEPVTPPRSAPPERIEGLSHADWTGRWWRWAFSFPRGFEPYRDPDGRLCEHGQQGPVWFLAGTDGSFDARRRCRVPADRYLLVPVINMIVYTPRSGPDARPCSRLRETAAVNNDHLRSAVVVLDGERLPPASVRRLATERCFDLFPERDGGDAPRVHAAADGYWLLLSPLPPGRHVLSVGANYAAPGEAAYGSMVQNFEYVLDVGEPTI